MNEHPSLFRQLKQIYRRRRLTRAGVVESLNCSMQAVGEGSGAWMTRVDVLDNTSVVYSFGAGTDISFDLELHHLTGAEVHIFDPTPRSVEWMRQQHLPDGVKFHEIGIADHDGTISFHAPKRSSSSHFSPVVRYRDQQQAETVEAPVARLSTLADELKHEHVDLIKLDIEGGEYDVIADLVNNDYDIGQILIEFHHAYATIPLARTAEAVSTLRTAGYECFHISPRTYELSFTRADHSY
ncbi:MAG: hypothetical protein DHS20C01_11290 [marine bacterium B5-7]|nr:MAG: hypothetical protein DHS20C01_11290 [marine bacterium B5-7]